MSLENHHKVEQQVAKVGDHSGDTLREGSQGISAGNIFAGHDTMRLAMASDAMATKGTPALLENLNKFPPERGTELLSNYLAKGMAAAEAWGQTIADKTAHLGRVQTVAAMQPEQGPRRSV